MLDVFHEQLQLRQRAQDKRNGSKQERVDEVNRVAASIKADFGSRICELEVADRPNYALVLQYCFSVAILEYRHAAWPYEYMAFSRRIGELWQAFCSVAWSYPSRPSVDRFVAPTFDGVRNKLLRRLRDNIGAHAREREIVGDIDTLFEIIGDINMREDEVFYVDGIPHVVDFKSGFGSNEKGNMLRLQAVGRAYRIWDNSTRLLLLVRQNENNNYLSVLRRSGLWDVHTGDEAYKQISKLTGADVQAVRARVIDWSSDLSADFYHFLKCQPTDLRVYLEW